MALVGILYFSGFQLNESGWYSIRSKERSYSAFWGVLFKTAQKGGWHMLVVTEWENSLGYLLVTENYE